MSDDKGKVDYKINSKTEKLKPIKRITPQFKDTLVRGTLRNLDDATTGVGGYESEDEENSGRKSGVFERTYDNAKKTRSIFNKVRNGELAKKGAQKGAKLAGKAGKAAGSAATTSTSAGAGVGTAAISPVAIIGIIAAIGLLCLLFAIISLFDVEDYDKESKQLDFGYNDVIKLNKQKEAIKETYKDLIENATTEEERKKYENAQTRAIAKLGIGDYVSKEDKKDGFPVLDSSKRIYLNIEKMSYAYGGYLNWEPEYEKKNIDICDESLVTLNQDNMNSLIPLCNEIGTKYLIDPAILLAIIEVQSGGDFHHNELKNTDYKGLTSMGNDFSLYFDSSEEEHFYLDSKKVPQDIGLCNCDDINHTNTARFHIEYLARKLTGIMTYFLQEAKNSNFIVDSISFDELNEAIPFAITAYNQGEFLQMDFYNTYKDKNIYSNNGDTYKEFFEKSMIDNGIKKGTELSNAKYSDGYMLEKENSTYLKRVYKAYEKYAKKSLSTAAQNYDYTQLSQKWYSNHFAYQKSYLNTDVKIKYSIDDQEAIYDVTKKEEKEVVLSPEDALIEEMNKQIEKETKREEIKQYNSWMLMIDEDNFRKMPDSFILKDGSKIPELWAKDENGNSLGYPIKHKSYIHNIVSEVKQYKTEKEFKNGNIDADYQSLISYLKDGPIEGEEKVEYKINEMLAGLEKDYAVSVEDITGQVLKNVAMPSDTFSDENMDNIVELLTKYLSYTVPLYEYITLDEKQAKKTFFNSEIYDSNSYTKENVLKINKEHMKNIITKAGGDNKSILKYMYGEITDDELKDSMKNLYRTLYLDNRIIESKNHSYTIPNNKDNYYLKVGNKYCDEYVENVIVTEIYEKYESLSEDDNTKNTINTLKDVKDFGDMTYIGMTASITRGIGIANLKPYKFTSVLDDEVTNFTYEKEINGDRNIADNDVESVYWQRDTITETDEEGNSYPVGYKYTIQVNKKNTYAEVLQRYKEKVARSSIS